MSEQKTGRTVQEQLDQLLAEGKKTGKLPSKRLLDTLDQLDAEPEVLEQFYDALESAGVEITVDDILDSFTPDGEVQPAEPVELRAGRKSYPELHRNGYRI